MNSILLIEDSRDYAEMLASNLTREGFDVSIASTGVDGLKQIRARAPDLIILDLMLPTMSGFTVLQRVRDEGNNTPVLIMTALGMEEEKLRGFGLGADDYIVKPCGLREILARVRALLKRTSASAAAQSNTFQLHDITVDFSARTVHRDADALQLRPKEFDLLAALIRHKGRVVSRDELLREVWGYSSGTESRTVETHLAALRQRLGDEPQSSRYVVTVRGAGYRLSETRK